MKKRRKLWIWLSAILAIIAILVGACAIYLLNYYHADEDAIEAFLGEDTLTYSVLEDGSIVYEPDGATAGFIFYPGGKVEHKAYIPLMHALAERGIVTILVEMPFRLAVFDVDAADGLQALFLNIESWYIGGHSLGGSMAAAYLSENVSRYDGLVLLAAYSTEDLTSTDLRVLSVYGSEDKVLNMKKYRKNKANLPGGFEETVIEGGCHAYFGMYGRQDGDGTPTVTAEEQILITSDRIANFIHMAEEAS